MNNKFKEQLDTAVAGAIAMLIALVCLVAVIAGICGALI